MSKLENLTQVDIVDFVHHKILHGHRIIIIIIIIIIITVFFL
jgi:hypothetical protein